MCSTFMLNFVVDITPKSCCCISLVLMLNHFWNQIFSKWNHFQVSEREDSTISRQAAQKQQIHLI